MKKLIFSAILAGVCVLPLSSRPLKAQAACEHGGRVPSTAPGSVPTAVPVFTLYENESLIFNGPTCLKIFMSGDDSSFLTVTATAVQSSTYDGRYMLVTLAEPVKRPLRSGRRIIKVPQDAYFILPVNSTWEFIELDASGYERSTANINSGFTIWISGDRRSGPMPSGTLDPESSVVIR